jgi:multicomponent Na+:H+ antiporter subunit C
MMIVTGLGLALILTGLWGIITRKNIIKIIIGFAILDTGVNIVLVSTGFIKGGTAPILDLDELLKNTASKIIDPVPSALVLTAIVIGLAVTALMLVYAVEMHRHNKTLNINEYRETKW